MDLTGSIQTDDSIPVVSVIVPARNEEASLADCLESLVGQRDVAHEIVVVDDGSTDGTRKIAESLARVRVISPSPLPAGWTGKNNALIAGAAAARGEWLLFTDADTVHSPGSLARTLAEAKEHDAAMLSYSPGQIAVTLWEMAILPVVFAELAREYPPKKVSDPNSPIAAANGQYILIRREAYEAVGGHAAIADSLLEDVALARRMKAAGRKIRFRYGADAVRTRMYRNWPQLRDGWTKNLALLFPHPGRLAAMLLACWVGAWGLFLAPRLPVFGKHIPWMVSGAVVVPVMFLTQRLRRANFTWDLELLGGLFGYPMFAYLLLRSMRAYAKGRVSWKGRSYKPASNPERIRQAKEGNAMLLRIDN